MSFNSYDQTIFDIGLAFGDCADSGAQYSTWILGKKTRNCFDRRLFVSKGERLIFYYGVMYVSTSQIYGGRWGVEDVHDL